MTEQRRVAFLSLHTSPLERPGAGDAGGMNVYVRSLASALSRIDVEVEIFTRATSPDQALTEHPEPGVCVHNIPAGPRRKIPKEELPALVSDMAEAINAIRQTQSAGHYDLIHSHYWLSGVAGLKLAERWQTPLIHTMHTMARVKNLHLASGECAEPKNRVQGEQLVVEHAARLIANTDAEKSELIRHYGADPERVDVVAPGVDLSVFNPNFRSQARQHVGVSPSDFHVVFAGRLQRLKGAHILIDAAADLLRRRPDIPLRLSFLGEQSGSRTYDVPALLARAGLTGRAEQRGAVSRRELSQWFRAADVVAVPSFSESFGLVALEAQACGTPVLATRVGGLCNAVNDGVSGLLVDGHRVSSWSAALEKLHDDRVLRGRLATGAVTHASHFTWEIAARRTLGSYTTALSKSGVLSS